MVEIADMLFDALARTLTAALVLCSAAFAVVLIRDILNSQELKDRREKRRSSHASNSREDLSR